MNKEELGHRYYEVKSLQLLTYLLKNDKDALWRVLNRIKSAIQQEEAGQQASDLLERVKKKPVDGKR
jgi:YesN/AraC family two-component response regulator